MGEGGEGERKNRGGKEIRIGGGVGEGWGRGRRTHMDLTINCSFEVVGFF